MLWLLIKFVKYVGAEHLTAYYKCSRLKSPSRLWLMEYLVDRKNVIEVAKKGNLRELGRWRKFKTEYFFEWWNLIGVDKQCLNTLSMLKFNRSYKWEVLVG